MNTLKPGTRVKLVKPDPNRNIHELFHPKYADMGKEGMIIKTFTNCYKIRFDRTPTGWGYYWHEVVEEVKA